MVNPGIWVRWRHELPPYGVKVEVRMSDEVAEIRRGTRCKRGCCFYDENIDDALIQPKWWRLPEQLPRNREHE